MHLSLKALGPWNESSLELFDINLLFQQRRTFRIFSFVVLVLLQSLKLNYLCQIAIHPFSLLFILLGLHWDRAYFCRHWAKVEFSHPTNTGRNTTQI